MITKSDIEKMSFKERVEALELLWESISSNPSDIKSPDWHQKILTKREERMRSDNARYYTLDEVRA